jgi:hypothetical protein
MRFGLSVNTLVVLTVAACSKNSGNQQNVGAQTPLVGSYSCAAGGTTPPSRLIMHAADGLPGKYIVVLAAETADLSATAQQLATKYGGTVMQVWASLGMFSVRIDDASAPLLAAEAAVCWVEQDSVAAASYAQCESHPGGVQSDSAAVTATVAQLVPAGAQVRCTDTATFTVEGREVQLVSVAYGNLNDCVAGCFSSELCAIYDGGTALLYSGMWWGSAEMPVGLPAGCPVLGESTRACRPPPAGTQHAVAATAAFLHFRAAQFAAGDPGAFRYCFFSASEPPSTSSDGRVTTLPVTGARSTCAWPEGADTYDATTGIGCRADHGFGMCTVPDGATVNADGTVTAPPGITVTCSNACSTTQYALSCRGAGEGTSVPQPAAGLGCSVIPIPTPSNALFWCCGCPGR